MIMNTGTNCMSFVKIMDDINKKNRYVDRIRNLLYRKKSRNTEENKIVE